MKNNFKRALQAFFDAFQEGVDENVQQEKRFFADVREDAEQLRHNAPEQQHSPCATEG